MNEGRYILRKNGLLYEIEIIDISELCYKLKFENGATIWITKKDFDYDYDVIEKLPKIA